MTAAPGPPKPSLPAAQAVVIIALAVVITVCFLGTLWITRTT
jgi:hypothetical protein